MTQAAGPGGYRVVSQGAYWVGVIQNLDKQGYCGGLYAEELAVTNTRGYSENYDILDDRGFARRGANSYPSPGARTDILLFLVNRTSTDETLRLSLDGLPEGWVKYSTPQEVSLAAGEQKGITLSIHPALAWQSRAGQHTFTLRVTSLANPNNVIVLQCTLTIATYSQFRCLVKPPRVMEGQPAHVVVSNQGNVPQTYTIAWDSPGDALAFTPPAAQVLRIDPGKIAAVDFTATPRRRRWFGDQDNYPYLVQVQPVRGQVHQITGYVSGKGLFPIWILPVALLICLVMVMVPLVAIFVDRLPPPGALR